MLHTKRLAHRDREKEIRKPQRTKHLFFTLVGTVALSSLLSCTHAGAAPKSSLPDREVPVMVASEKTQRSQCGADVSRALREGERYIESRCTESYEFVLTSENLIVFPRGKTNGSGAFSVTLDNQSMEVKDLLMPGVIDWEASDKCCYFLLGDGTLLFIPLDTDDKSVTKYKMQFGIDGMGKDSMVHFAGSILLADPRGYVVLLSDSEEGEWKPLDVGQSRRIGLVVKGNRLLVSRDGIENEIEIGKDGPRMAGP